MGRLVVGLLLAIILALPVRAAEPGEGVIQGTIVNGTADGSSVAGQTVQLKAFVDGDEVHSATTTADEEGRFTFTGLSTAPTYRYEIGIEFQGVVYGGVVTFETGETSQPLEITVYDATTSPEAITVSSAHTIIYVAEDRLLVEEIYFFSNGADRTYVGSEDRLVGDGRRETLRFSLPEGAGEVQVVAGLTGCCLFVTADGFLHTMPVLPGMTQVIYSYEITQAGDGYVFTWNTYFPTQQYDFLVQSDTVQLESEGLFRAEPLEIEGVTYAHLVANDLPPGRSLSVRMSGLRPGGGPPPVVWVALALAALAGGAGFFYARRRRQVEPAAADVAGEVSREELLAELARLDDDFEDGVIAEAEYRRLRSEKKARLLGLMERPGQGDGR